MTTTMTMRRRRRIDLLQFVRTLTRMYMYSSNHRLAVRMDECCDKSRATFVPIIF